MFYILKRVAPVLVCKHEGKGSVTLAYNVHKGLHVNTFHHHIEVNLLKANKIHFHKQCRRKSNSPGIYTSRVCYLYHLPMSSIRSIYVLYSVVSMTKWAGLCGLRPSLDCQWRGTPDSWTLTQCEMFWSSLLLEF